MKTFKILIGIAIIIAIQSCASSSGTTQISEGETAYQAGNYELALNSYEPIIISRESKGKKAKGPVYVGAGKSALALEQNDKARKYLESAKEVQYSSPEMYECLAEVYKNIDNLSKEITALETYHEKYPQGKKINNIDNRLLETYVESENWDLGVKLWADIDSSAKSDPGLLSNYLLINIGLNDQPKCDELAKQITKLDPNNIIALEYYAEKYFWKAENLYVKEMKAYKNKRTSSQYKKLLKALDQVWPNFKKSRDYFLKLYKMDPKPEYAGFLSKIYTRYDDKKKPHIIVKELNKNQNYMILNLEKN